MKTMKSMKQMEPTAEKICFVGLWLNKTNFIWAVNGKNASFCLICFMFFEVVRTFSSWSVENMKIMKMYEAMFIKGIYLSCFIGRGLPAQKHEANMKMYEEVMA